eukprot:4560270-Pleurochrysis_carterae.AAC.4
MSPASKLHGTGFPVPGNTQRPLGAFLTCAGHTIDEAQHRQCGAGNGNAADGAGNDAVANRVSYGDGNGGATNTQPVRDALRIMLCDNPL